MGNFRPHWFGDYELVQLLGVGGMAEVFLARTLGAQGFEKLVVVKRILPKLALNERFVQMFAGEAKLSVRLQHASIVQVLSFEEHLGQPFIVMEFVHGKDLFAVLSGAAEHRIELPFDFGIHCLVEMLKGLSYAHTARGADGRPLNLVHRDVTPSNVFISFDGEVKLGDFGVAHSAGEVQAAEVRGKLSYLAPEALHGKQLDARADLFSAGVVLWETLAQRRLFSGATDGEVLLQVRDRMPEPPSTHNRRVAPDLDLIALKALEKDPAKRFQSAQQFEEALGDYLFARRLRWTRQRIADVMHAIYQEESKPLQLPPPSPRTNTLAEDDWSDFSDETTREVAKALLGLDQTPSKPPQSRVGSSVHWAESIESGIIGIQEIDAMILAQAAKRQADDQLLVYPTGRMSPLPIKIDDLIVQLSTQPDSVSAIGVSGDWRMPIREFAQLAYWDTIAGYAEPTDPPATQASFSALSVTRLIYELTMRRMTGAVAFEDGEGRSRRLLYLEGGYPLYVASNQPADGAPAMIQRYHMLENASLYRALVQLIGDRMSLDQALIAVVGDNGRKRVENAFSALIRHRLFRTFGWSHGRFRVWPQAAQPVRLATPLAPLLGILVRGVQSAFSLEELRARMQLRGQRAVVLTAGRDQHVAALRIRPGEQPVIAAIDGQRNLTQVIQATNAASPDQEQRALAVLYVLAETQLAQFL